MILDAIFTRGLFVIRRYGLGDRDALGRQPRILVSNTPANGLIQAASGSGSPASIETEGFVVNRFAATMPVGTDVRQDDEVECRGMLLTVEGTPSTATIPGMPAVGIVTAVLRYVGPVTP